MRTISLLLAFALAGFISAQTEKPKPAPPKAWIEPDKVDDTDFAIQGEYAGSIGEEKVGVQIIALGNHEFEAVGYKGGLPGAGWDGDRSTVKRVKSSATTTNGATLVTFEHENLKAIADGAHVVVTRDGEKAGDLPRVKRESPTLGTKPPQGAIILFDGKDVSHFPGGKMTAEGLLEQGATSSDKFGDCTLHVEFMLSYMPTARGQGRSNSGVYMQGRYEVQVLDSFGLEGKSNECGGIYSIHEPKVNMCFPPLTWQTYDVDFTAAKYDAAGKKTANARITVKHNGIIVHENVEIPHGTTAAPVKEDAAAGPLYLQNHGNPVRFRNIWLVTK